MLHVPTTSGARNGVHSRSDGYPADGGKGQRQRTAFVRSLISSVKARSHIVGSDVAVALTFLQRRRAKLALFWDQTGNWVRDGAGPWGLRRLKQRALATTFIFGLRPTSYLAVLLPASGSD